MKKYLFVYMYLEFFDEDCYRFNFLANYEINGFKFMKKDFKEENFAKFQNNLIDNYLDKMFNGSDEI